MVEHDTKAPEAMTWRDPNTEPSQINYNPEKTFAAFQLAKQEGRSLLSLEFDNGTKSALQIIWRTDEFETEIRDCLSMTWRDPNDATGIVVIEAGKLYNTRGAGVVLIEEMRVARCTVSNIGQPVKVVEEPYWVGTYVDTGTRGTWGFWGAYSLVSYNTNDIVDAAGN